MWRVNKGHKVKNVKSGDNVRHYNQGELLPKDYVPPKTFIEQKIVLEVQSHGNRKTR